MRKLAALILVSFARIAIADPAPATPPTGLFELTSYTNGTDVTNLHDAMMKQVKAQGMDVLDVRMTFDLKPDKITVQTFMFDREKDGSGSACEAELTLDIQWKGMTLIIPSGGTAASRFVHVTKSVKKEADKTSSKTSSKSTSDENTCDATLQANTLKAVYNNKELWLVLPSGAHYLMTPMRAPIGFDRESLAGRL